MNMESIGSYSMRADAVLDDMNGLEATELRLGLPGTSSSTTKTKRPIDDQESTTSCNDVETTALRPAKSQVVGWPPVQAFRRNVRHGQPNQANKASPPTATAAQTAAPAALLVKVSMDGAPYLRKIDLGAYNGYKELRLALDAMFRSCSSALHQQLTYEDKEGDWMLVGDVPWEMFVASCKRLRIVKAFNGLNRVGSMEQLRSDDLTLTT